MGEVGITITQPAQNAQFPFLKQAQHPAFYSLRERGVHGHSFLLADGRNRFLRNMKRRAELFVVHVPLVRSDGIHAVVSTEKLYHHHNIIVLILVSGRLKSAQIHLIQPQGRYYPQPHCRIFYKASSSHIFCT
ncbi:hypothetical protein D9M69_471730 [compost metagenome]